ncbi:MAG: carbohydrate binding family 9 domain-containing protein [Bacteroidales bacterium]|nr:carbohydrate binding family 9 domain-containing protein [Bacteroidales bacterium]
MKKILTSVTIIFLIVSFAFGQNTEKQNPEKKRYQATKVQVAPEINGILDDEAWNEGTWIDDFIQNEPYNGKQASQRTEFKILFDEDNLYVAFKAFDTSPDSIVNRMTRRDQVDGDLVAIIVDSFHDLRTGFVFGVSSASVKYDFMLTNDGQNENQSWDPNWWVKTSINNEGWIAEIKIPFSQVRFEKNSGDVWGLEMARIFYRKNETDFWQHIPSDAPGFVHMFGELSGLEQIKPRKIFDVTPYGVAKAQTFKKEPENPFMAKGRKYRINGGIDAKIGVTNNMTMDLTINPDFGQVEADPSEVNLTAYETFFQEKRPFFIEGNNITNFNIGLGDGDVGNDNLFYSRRIGRRPQGYPNLNDGWNADVPGFTSILGAAKLTGKTKNGLSLGFIEAVTAEEKAEIDTTGGRTFETVEPLTNYLVGRVQRDFKDGNTILGGIITSTNRDLDDNLGSYMHKSAYSGGFDFTQYFRKKSWMFNLNAALSQVNGSKEVLELTQRSSARYFQRPDNDYTVFDPERTSLTGSGGRMQIQKLNGHLFLLGCVLWRTPGFETNDLGYIQQADEVLTVLAAGYNQWDPKWIYRSFNINGDFYFVYNFGGDLTGKGFEWNASINLKNYWSAWTGGNFNGSSLSTGMLRGGPMMRMPGSTNARIGFSTDNRKKLVFNVFANGSKGNENNSRSLYTELDVTYKPTNFLFLTLSPGFSKSFSELQYVRRLNYNGKDKYIFASIDRKTINASFRINLNLSPDLTLQYWGQPFVATGKYYDHKYILAPMAEEFRERFWTYSTAQKTFDTENNNYRIDEYIDGTTDYTIGNNDFNIQEFLSNLVVRWEYNPGSTVYLVWSQTRSYSNGSGVMNLFSDIGDLFDRDNNIPKNVFLIKLSYRFGLK